VDPNPAGVYADTLNTYLGFLGNPIRFTDAQGMQAATQPAVGDLGIQGLNFTPGGNPQLDIVWLPKKEGFIVQHILVSVWIWRCHGNIEDTTKERQFIGDTPTNFHYYQYWESWHVETINGTLTVGYDSFNNVMVGDSSGVEPSTSFTSLAGGASDTFGLSGEDKGKNFLDDTYGYASIQGWAKYVVGDPQFYNWYGKKDPSIPTKWAGYLPSSKTAPAGWSDAGTVYHWLIWQWHHPQGGPNWDDSDNAWPKPGEQG
jgi:hypothetical protein